MSSAFWARITDGADEIAIAVLLMREDMLYAGADR